MSSSAVLTFLAVVCAAASGFTLQDHDSYLNLFTEDDSVSQEALDYASGIYARSRLTRDASGKHHMHHMQCCGSTPLQLTDDDKAAMAECKPEKSPEDASAEDKKLMWQQKFACSAQCMGDKKGLLDTDGYVKADDFKTAYMARVTDAGLKDITEKSIDECVPLANEKSKAHGIVEKDGKTCNGALGAAVMCVRFKTETNCPDDQQVKSPECDDKRAKMAKWAEKLKSE